METISAAVAGTKKTAASRWLGCIVFTALLALPLTASAASWWCTWFPWFPVCALESDAGNGQSIGPIGEVAAFGSNPGNLKMFRYVPPNLPAARALVVALHGCKQQASHYDEEPGWVRFADKYRFALLLPQQQAANNSSKCFNWFQSGDNARDKGEALSIRQMIAKIKTDLNIDPKRIYVTGLSAGGAMTAVMLAAYPEVFAGGAIIAGVPYRCAANVNEALDRCGVSMVPGRLSPMKSLAPAQWGALVRNASTHSGPFPPVSLWQGTTDTTVNPLDQHELLKQWTSVHGVDQVPDTVQTIGAHTRKVYKNQSGKPMVETFVIEGMGHGAPIDPGAGEHQCGTPAPFILNAGICSSFHIIKFWGLDA